jgi:hypothetical protein
MLYTSKSSYDLHSDVRDFLALSYSIKGARLSLRNVSVVIRSFSEVSIEHQGMGHGGMAACGACALCMACHFRVTSCRVSQIFRFIFRGSHVITIANCNLQPTKSYNVKR